MALSQVTSVSPEARAVLAGRGELGDRETWSAVVVKDPVIKVTSNFISRVERTTKIKQFATEEEAIPWLDTRVREDLAAKAT